MTKNPDVQTGDWVIVLDYFLNYAYEIYGVKIKRERYRYPQKVLEVFVDENNLKGVKINSCSGKQWALSYNEFRLANKREIKENTIKNIFQINI